MHHILTLIFSLISFVTFANEYKDFKIDNSTIHEKFKVKMSSGKKDDLRFYKITHQKNFEEDIYSVLNSITNFEDKCNNEYKDKRKLLNKDIECRYHNGNLVESKVYKELKEYSKDNHEIDRMLVARRIYNRENFSHIDMVKIYETINEKGNKVITVKVEMISDKEAQKYIKPPVERDSVFQKAYSEFKLTALTDKNTHLEFSYTNETDHWLLNKSVSVNQVFDSMAKSIDLLFHSIQKELAIQSSKNIKDRAVAYKK